MLASVKNIALKLFDKTLGKRKVLESTKFFIYFAFPAGMVYFFGSGRYGLLDIFIEKVRMLLVRFSHSLVCIP